MTTRKRGNGQGTLFRRKAGGVWHFSWYDEEGERRSRSTGTTSRADAERIGRKWVEHVALVREGLAKPEGGTVLDRHAQANIDAHFEAFESAKHAEGRTERHVAETLTMIRLVAKECRWKKLNDIAADELERFTGRKLAPSNGEAAWSPRTAHKYITAMRTFMRWCVADGRLPADPLARVKKPAPIRQNDRRFLHIEEWKWLRGATEHGPERCKMNGRERRLLYELAVQTGLRSSELSALTRTALLLDAEKPYVLLEARSTKNRKAARQYIRPGLAAELAELASRLMPGAKVFSMPRREHVAAMLRADLQAARQAWVNEAPPAERMNREQSDFLLAEDHDGRTLDFHSLRHTCGAWAAMGGASPKAVQTLMRHSSITLTLDTYGHLLPDEASETVARMPEMQEIRLALTGTDSSLETARSATAVATATGVQTGAIRSELVRHAKNENGPGGMPRPFLKRGGRDSNPQPPDRQSGTLTN
jgi:integrase